MFLSTDHALKTPFSIYLITLVFLKPFLKQLLRYVNKCLKRPQIGGYSQILYTVNSRIIYRKRILYTDF